MNATLIIASIVVAWGLCGILEYGLCLAFFQREFPSLADQYRVADKRRALLYAFIGPISLVATLVCRHYGHGFMWRLPPRRKS